jgi:uncharacterized coiled-coil protein SlyX
MGIGVPVQALKAAEEAEKLYQEQIDGLVPKTPEEIKAGEDKVAKGEGETVEVPKTEPEKVAEEVIEETSEQKAEKAQHKYDVLQGKYNKEVPELAQRLAEQTGTIKALQDQINALAVGKKLEEKDTKGVLDSFEQDPNIKYLKTEYPEVWKGIESGIEKLAIDTSKKIEVLSSQITEQERKIHKTDEDRFYDDINTVENWKEINNSVEFNEWLDRTEPLTGFKRRAILDDAYATLNSTRAKNFFSEFMGKKVKPVVDVKDTSFVVSDKGISPRTTTGKPLIDRSELKENFIKATDVSKFYNDVRKGLYKGRDAEKDKIEAEINKAISDRRVIAGQ